MGKDLRTTPVQWKLHRYPPLQTSTWNLENAQPFFPSLEKLFKVEQVSSLPQYGVKLSEQIDTIVDEHTIRTTKGNVVPIHRKTTMILSPFKWMRGDYGNIGLPKPESTANEMQNSLQSPHTAGYVGALTSIALSESGCIHFPKVYGVYVGMATKHTIDISDDYEDLSDRPWFANNLGKTFELKLRSVPSEPEFKHTRSNRPELKVQDEQVALDVEDIEAEHVDAPRSARQSECSTYLGSELGSNDHESSDTDSDVFEIESCDCESDEEDDEDYGEDDDEPYAWATFKQIPVITTVMEKCDGTFYDLIMKHPEPEKHFAWVGQLILALAYAQRMFGMTHNDLHGNNVMYVPTTTEYLYYNYHGTCYKLPTYGYIIKVIDFDRAITSIRLVGMKEPRQFVSSQFHQEDEAGGQYNMDPYFIQKAPHIPPNPSFDLTRFATSLFWDLFPQGPDSNSSHPLFELFKHWTTQSDATSVLFRKQRDNHDRYHGFHLYKAIARRCKDNAVPRKEISRLSMFQVPSVPLGTSCLLVDQSEYLRA